MKHFLQSLTAFLNGMREFRTDFTTRYCDEIGYYDHRDVAYDWGREWAHRLTFRHWDEV